MREKRQSFVITDLISSRSKMAKEVIGPQSEFQERCLTSDARIIIMGG